MQDQNSADAIALLSAQRRIYREAKLIRQVRALAAVALSTIGPLVGLLVVEARPAIAVIGGGWAIISRLFLQRLEKGKVRRAATVQEQFDSDVLGIPWNATLVGRRVEPELVLEAAAHISVAERQQLRDWYPDAVGITPTLAALICQRANLTWDVRQRRLLATIIGGATVLGFLVGVVVGWCKGETLQSYVLAILVPSLSAYLLGVDAALEHWENAASKEKLEHDIRASLEAASTVVPEWERIRAIQDRIFLLRIVGAAVPDWLYRRLRPRYDVQMLAAAEQWIEKFRQAR